jgi:site-specific DNA-cytosine methylase
VANGVPGRVHRLKQLGNSIVPQVAARILHAIKEADSASEIRD